MRNCFSLLECLNYNEVYDLYHDDYPALYVGGEETQVQQLGTYHQYQSFTDVAAIEGKLVISSSWHPNYTGMHLQKSLMSIYSYFLESYLQLLMLFILVTLKEQMKITDENNKCHPI